MTQRTKIVDRIVPDIDISPNISSQLPLLMIRAPLETEVGIRAARRALIGASRA